MNIISRKYFLIISLSFLCIYNNVTAQDDPTLQTWTDLTTSHWIDQNWQYMGDYGIRGIISPEDWSSIYIRPSFLYRLDEKFSLRGGLGVVYTSQEPESNTFEVRPWQGAKAVWPRFSFVVFENYARLEERFVWDTQDSDFSTTLRFRYKITGKFYNFLIPPIKSKFYFYVAFEMFANLFGDDINEKFASEKRVTFALGNYITDKLSVEFDYTRESTRDDNDNPELAYNILRMRFKIFFN